MKKIFSFVAAALMSASLFAGPAAIPTVQDVATAGYDVTSARVIVIYFDEEVCNDIVWAGSYKMSGSGWVTDPEELSKFEPLENYPGWYVVEVFDESETVQGKPVQLKKDGSFSWEFQSGDVDAWINMAQPGSKTAEINAGFYGEADLTWPEKGVYIYELAYFKNHNTPCGAGNPTHDYYITAYLPDFCDEIAAYADSARVMGGFDGWSDGIWMTKTYDEDFNMIWTATLNDVEEGTEFKLRFGTDADWAVQVRKDGQNLGNEMTGETTDIILQFDGEGYDFAACAGHKVTPITCAEAVAIAQGLEPNTPSTETYTVEGYVISVIKPSATDLRFWMADSLNVEAGIFEAWMCTGEVVKKGDKVTVTGNLQWYVNLNNPNEQKAEISGGTVAVVEAAPIDENYVEFYPFDFEGMGVSGGGEISVTKNGVTIYTDGGFGASYSLRVYKNKQFKISADRRIVSIAFEFDNYDKDYSGGLDPEVCVEGTEWGTTLASQGRFSKIAVTLGDGECGICSLTLYTDVTRGTVSGAGKYIKGDTCTLTATANYGYHFTQWNDGNTDNPRKVIVTQDTTFTAEFAKNNYSFEVKANDDERGSVEGTNGTYEYQTELTVSATARLDLGYHFAQWSDGNRDNPRILTLTENTVLVAQFEANQCGDDLMWYLKDNELLITGTGAMYDYNPWFISWSSWASQITSISLPDGLTHIGTNAFEYCYNVQKIEIPTTVTSIGNSAFQGCSALADIYSYAVNPPIAYNNTFEDVSKHCYIHVPVGAARSYQLAIGWRDFYHIVEISALPDGTTEVGVTVTNNYATFSWPVNPTASSYTLEITKDGELFCTLIFNSLGQLVGMAFAPGQGHNAPAATSTSYGYSFVVTGLTDNTTYAYTFSIRDEYDDIIETKSGTFKTTGGTPTSVDEVHGSQPTMHKVLRNGQILLERNNVTYTLMGQKVK